jgi:hypothetical protein
VRNSEFSADIGGQQRRTLQPASASCSVREEPPKLPCSRVGNAKHTGPAIVLKQLIRRPDRQGYGLAAHVRHERAMLPGDVLLASGMICDSAVQPLASCRSPSALARQSISITTAIGDSFSLALSQAKTTHPPPRHLASMCGDPGLTFVRGAAPACLPGPSTHRVPVSVASPTPQTSTALSERKRTHEIAQSVDSAVMLTPAASVRASPNETPARNSSKRISPLPAVPSRGNRIA